MAEDSTGIDWSKYVEPTSTPQTGGVITRLSDIRKAEEAQAKKDNDYTVMFTEPFDKITADANSDGKIDFNEYKAYIINNHDDKSSTLQSHKQEDNNNNNNQNYYYFDSNLLIAIGMICVTTIIISWIKRKS